MRWVRVDNIWDEVGSKMHKENSDVAVHVESLLGWGQPIHVNGDEFECLKDFPTASRTKSKEVK